MSKKMRIPKSKRAAVGRKVGVNIREWKKGRWKSRAQAIAVGISEATHKKKRKKKGR